jgi:hypothetical protein
MKSVVIQAETTAPRFNDVSLEYAGSRAFVKGAPWGQDPERQTPVERVVQYNRKTLFSGKTFGDVSDVRVGAPICCTDTPGVCALMAPLSIAN